MILQETKTMTYIIQTLKIGFDKILPKNIFLPNSTFISAVGSILGISIVSFLQAPIMFANKTDSMMIFLHFKK